MKYNRPVIETIILTESDIAYIKANHKTQSVAKMAKTLHRGMKTLYDFMEVNKISIHRLKPASRGRSFSGYVSGPGYFKMPDNWLKMVI